ncbi:PqqD family protein [Patescibacteria group bacterium]|nr:PqqD family protein [Patescibacteria group bacterium]
MKYQIKEGTVWEEIDGKITVLDPKQGKYFVLNETAGDIWRYLERPITEEDVVKKIFSKYESGSGGEEMVVQIKECLKELVGFEVLRVS